MQRGRVNVVPGLKNKLLAFGMGLVPFQRLKLAMAALFVRKSK